MRLFEFDLLDGRKVFLNLETQLHSFEPITADDDVPNACTHITMFAPDGFVHYNVTASVQDILRHVARSVDEAPGYKVYTNPQMRR